MNCFLRVPLLIATFVAGFLTFSALPIAYLKQQGAADSHVGFVLTPVACKAGSQRAVFFATKDAILAGLPYGQDSSRQCVCGGDGLCACAVDGLTVEEGRALSDAVSRSRQ